MQLEKNRPRWVAADGIKPALLVGAVLFAASYGLDLILSLLSVPGSTTFLNDLVIGVIGGLVVLILISAVQERQNFARAKEQMVFVAEVNQNIRKALTGVIESATIGDQNERLRRVDEAVSRVDEVLLNLVPAMGSTRRTTHAFSLKSLF